jgi:hypothetical protein
MRIGALSPQYSLETSGSRERGLCEREIEYYRLVAKPEIGFGCWQEPVHVGRHRCCRLPERYEAPRTSSQVGAIADALQAQPHRVLLRVLDDGCGSDPQEVHALRDYSIEAVAQKLSPAELTSE